MLTVQDAVDMFLIANAADGLSARTSQWYETHLRAALRRSWALDVQNVEVGPIRQYLSDLRAKTSHYRGVDGKPGPVSVQTIRGRIRALKRFFNWCQLEGLINDAQNPMLRVRMPKSPGTEPKAITLDDLQKMLNATGDDLAGVRNKAMVAFMADTGCRAGGMLTLIPGNLFLDRGRAMVHEKGDRVRAVPFTRYTASLIQEWLEVRPQEAATVFCSLSTSKHRYAKPLTISGLYQMLDRLATKAGVEGLWNAHSFRHGYAREYLTNGGDLATLARLMGHSDVSVTTAFYAIFTDNELADRHEQFSPMSHIGGKR